ncbi:Uncharacterised protein [uncultured archaeon]|nr:Uncharacterised protein [uncultured archaeon]
MSFLTLPNSTAAAAPLNIPSGVAPASPIDGDYWYDTTQKSGKYFWNGLNYALGGAAIVYNAAPAALTALNGTGTFATLALPTAFMNVAGKVLRVRMWGIYTTAGAQTPTIGIQLGFSGAFTQTVLTATSQATTASQTNFPWNFEGHIYTVSTGASGTLEGHGALAILIGASATAPMSEYQDTNVAAGIAVNLTAASTNNLLLQAVTGSALSSIQMRTAVVEVLN